MGSALASLRQWVPHMELIASGGPGWNLLPRGGWEEALDLGPPPAKTRAPARPAALTWRCVSYSSGRTLLEVQPISLLARLSRMTMWRGRWVAAGVGSERITSSASPRRLTMGRAISLPGRGSGPGRCHGP